MKNRGPTYIESLYEPILAAITNSPLTSQEIAIAIDANYYSVRKAMTTLENDNRIVKFDRRARNARYTIGANNGPNTIIPELKWQSASVKATKYPAQLDAIRENFGERGASIIIAIDEILSLSEKIHNGTPLSTAEITLKRMRVKLHSQINAFDDIRFLAQQVLDNDKFWNPTALEKFPDDASWDDYKNPPPVGEE